jgi:hypothetical protein
MQMISGPDRFRRSKKSYPLEMVLAQCPGAVGLMLTIVARLFASAFETGGGRKSGCFQDAVKYGSHISIKMARSRNFAGQAALKVSNRMDESAQDRIGIWSGNTILSQCL